MSLPRPSSFARSSQNDPYSLRNGRNSTTTLNRGPFSLGSRSAGGNYIPLNYSSPPYDPYRYNYQPAPYRNPGPVYNASSSGMGLRTYVNPGLSLTPSAMTPLMYGNQLAPYRPQLLSNSASLGRCDNALCSHSDGKDSSGINLWRPVQLPCTTTTSSCCSKGEGYRCATKDILVRDTAKVIRASYLHENPKFEADLSKYLDKKNKDTVPDHVVDLLIDFINVDDYDNRDIVDEVTLCILATNVGAKSVVDKTLDNLKKIKGPMDVDLYQGCKITAMILMSTKVDKGLTAWLKKLLEKDNMRLANEVFSTREFQDILDDRPELEYELKRLLGIYQEPKDSGFRSM